MTAYYNEIDPYAAQWLRNLIATGIIPSGDVDERSIVDVRPDDLREYSQCHFFAGIGGWSIALRLAGWPDDKPVWTGSCPCQPFSSAGKRKGFDDPRYLWPVWFRSIRECRPAKVFGEQVATAIGWGWLDAVCADLEAEGYATGAAVLPAVGAPHIRQRLWFVADRSFGGWREERQDRRRLNVGNGAERLAAGFEPSGNIGLMADAADERHERNGTSWHRRGGPENVGELGDATEPRSFPGTFAGIRGGEESPGPRDAELERPGPTNGFWRDAEWIACTDGKARPVEPAIRSMADGISRAMGRLRAHQNLKEEIINAATGAGLGPEIMCALQSGVRPQEIWQSLGGCLGFSAATLLLAGMCQYSRELGNIFNGATSAIGQDQERLLRELWQDAPMSSRPPCRWQLSQQCRGKLADALSELSSQNPCLRETLESLAGFTGSPLAHGIRNRASQLRAYGNAIVPQTAAQFIRAVM